MYSCCWNAENRFAIVIRDCASVGVGVCETEYALYYDIAVISMRTGLGGVDAENPMHAENDVRVLRVGDDAFG
jgi:hypothetical protein